MPLVTSALFAERNRRGREGDRADHQAGEVKQESALVTAKDWPYHSFENVWQFVCGLPQSVGGNVSVLFGHGGRIVADEFPRHGI